MNIRKNPQENLMFDVFSSFFILFSFLVDPGTNSDLKKNFIYAFKTPDKKTKEKNFVSMIYPGYQIRGIPLLFCCK